MITEKISPKHKQMLETIKKFIVENGYALSNRELCKLCNIKSTSTVHNYLNTLCACDLIDLQDYKARAIKIL